MVAINKIDKPGAKPEEVKKQLADVGLLPEDWGGQTIFTEVSDTAFDRESAESTQKIDNTTGYFGKTIAQINEG